MALNNWIIWIVCIGVLSQAPDFGHPSEEGSGCSSQDNPDYESSMSKNQLTCTNHNATYLVMSNVTRTLFMSTNFSQAFCHDNERPDLPLSLFANKATFSTDIVKRKWPTVISNGSVLRLTKWLTKPDNRDLQICILNGTNCGEVVNQTKGQYESISSSKGTCSMECLETEVCERVTYDEDTCRPMYLQDNDAYFMNVSTGICTNCNNPVKEPEMEVDINEVIEDLGPVPMEPEQELDSGIANTLMSSFTPDFVDQFNESTVALTLGKSITGVCLKQPDPLDLEEVSFGYTNITESFNILEDRSTACHFSRSITVSKEAFERAMSLNVSRPFVAVFRFLNMTKDEHNSSVLGDEVIAIEMGAIIRNLTDTIDINFFRINYKGIPSCNSWKGNGSQPVWTKDGCETITNGTNITCRCTHMTFFAVLMTPLNEMISTSDLNTLTIITRIGCGLSMFFLGIVLFMHLVWRRSRSSKSTKILIHLVLAMFLLDFAFLINDFVAKAKNVIGCMIMAAMTHYFMLTTFSWFAVHAFHLCLQLYKGGKIEIRRYVLKVSIFSWVMPSIIGIVLISIGKYGEVVINTGDAETSVAMCWILDNDVHYIVNTLYYALVFLLTFSTFVLMLTWLYCLRNNQKAAKMKNVSSCQRIVTIMGLCCILGVTWGCAFFAYGIFRIPAYYIFTVLNSFQGFCLFIYYYKTSHMETRDPHSSSSCSSSSSSTLKTNLDTIFNPYDNNSTKSE